MSASGPLLTFDRTQSSTGGGVRAGSVRLRAGGASGVAHEFDARLADAAKAVSCGVFSDDARGLPGDDVGNGRYRHRVKAQPPATLI